MARKKETQAPATTETPENVDNGQSLPSGDDTGVANGQANNEKFDSVVESHASGYEGFNPEIHAMGPDGKPKMTKSGDFAKKRGRKAGASALPAPDAAPTASAAQVVSQEAAEMAAKTSCNLIFNGAVIALGEDWIPSKDEVTGLKMAFTDYYMVRGIPNIPPELALIGAVLAYAMPRPQTKAIIAKAKGMFKKTPEKLGEDEPQ